MAFWNRELHDHELNNSRVSRSSMSTWFWAWPIMTKLLYVNTKSVVVKKHANDHFNTLSLKITWFPLLFVISWHGAASWNSVKNSNKHFEVKHSVDKRSKPGSLVEIDFFSMKNVTKWLKMLFMGWIPLQAILKLKFQFILWSDSISLVGVLLYDLFRTADFCWVMSSPVTLVNDTKRSNQTRV